MQRQRIDLETGWVFQQRGKGEAVTLPHCWNVGDTFLDGVAYYRGKGTYTCAFRLAHEDRGSAGEWFLCCEGFYGRGTVELNGKSLGAVDGAYLGFRLNVSGTLHAPGENRLTITLSNKHHRHVLPGIEDPDFVLYGGLAGRVWLERRPALRFVDDSIQIRCVDDVLSISSELHNPDAAESISVRWRILSVDGECVAEMDVGTAGTATVNGLAQFDRWDIDSPVLYTAVGTLSVNGEPVDELRRRFGVRTIEFRKGEGFILNGRRVEIRGCNRHESMPGYGSALPLEQHRADAEAIRDMGLNAVRLAHYPQHPAFLDACDELGILVYAEIATWKSVVTGKWLDAAERQLRGMIQRDRHHASVILWGLGNESRSRQAYERLGAVAHELDPDRFTIYAENHLYRAKRQNALNLVDVWGCNYELDVLDEVSDYCKTGVALVSECSNSPHAVPGDEAMEQDQVERITRDLDTIAAHPACAGFFIWSFQDYATLRKKRYKRHCGLLDAWRKPKLAARMLKERFSGQSSGS
jgi:beta-galactosidase/beta-glucuronidase